MKLSIFAVLFIITVTTAFGQAPYPGAKRQKKLITAKAAEAGRGYESSETGKSTSSGYEVLSRTRSRTRIAVSGAGNQAKSTITNAGMFAQQCRPKPTGGTKPRPTRPFGPKTKNFDVASVGTDSGTNGYYNRTQGKTDGGCVVGEMNKHLSSHRRRGSAVVLLAGGPLPPKMRSLKNVGSPQTKPDRTYRP